MDTPGQMRLQSHRDDLMAELLAASGEFTSSSLLVDVFYTLMRDHIPSGVLTDVVFDAVASCRLGPGDKRYSNGHLARYAEYLANMLQEDTA